MFDENTIKTQMAEISTAFPNERKTLRDTYETLAKKEAIAWACVSLQDVEHLTDERAKTTLSRMIEAGVKMTLDDKKAIQFLEIEEEQLAYDLAKMDCATSEKNYEQLAAQLSYLQSEMKLR